MKAKKDVEVLLLEHLLSGCSASQRGFGDAHNTSRLAVYKRRLVQKGFPIQTRMVKFGNDIFGVYSL